MPSSFIASDRKSTRLNSSHEWISYAVFCLKKNKEPGRKDCNSKLVLTVRQEKSIFFQIFQLTWLYSVVYECDSVLYQVQARPLFFFNDTATTEIYTLSLRDALPLSVNGDRWIEALAVMERLEPAIVVPGHGDRKSTRLNSSHVWSSYAVFCLKK